MLFFFVWYTMWIIFSYNHIILSSFGFILYCRKYLFNLCWLAFYCVQFLCVFVLYGIWIWLMQWMFQSTALLSNRWIVISFSLNIEDSYRHNPCIHIPNVEMRNYTVSFSLIVICEVSGLQIIFLFCLFIYFCNKIILELSSMKNNKIKIYISK